MHTHILAVLVSSQLLALAATITVAPESEIKNFADALAKARDEKRAHPEEKIKILLKSGRYELNEPIQLSQADSGLSISAAPGEKPIVSGGRVIKNWQKDP